MEKYKTRNPQIAQRYFDGESKASLATAYKLSPTTISNMMCAMGVRQADARAKRNKKIVELYRAGETAGSIAEAHGLLAASVEAILVKANAKPKARARAHKAKEERDDIIAARYLDGESVASLAEAYGLNPRTVANMMTKMGASRNEVKADRNEKIRAAYDAGATVAELAKRHGLSTQRTVAIASTTGKAPRLLPPVCERRKRGQRDNGAQR